MKQQHFKIERIEVIWNNDWSSSRAELKIFIDEAFDFHEFYSNFVYNKKIEDNLTFYFAKDDETGIAKFLLHDSKDETGSYGDSMTLKVYGLNKKEETVTVKGWWSSNPITMLMHGFPMANKVVFIKEGQLAGWSGYITSDKLLNILRNLYLIWSI